MYNQRLKFTQVTYVNLLNKQWSYEIQLEKKNMENTKRKTSNDGIYARIYHSLEDKILVQRHLFCL